MAEQGTQGLASSGINPAGLFNRLENTQAAQVMATKPVVRSGEVNRQEKTERSGKNSPTEAAGNSSLKDVSLKFQIDDQTNDVTILILDRSSRRVVRTIPPEEMNKMDPGELLQLFA